jgi:hypothetical protein
MIMKIYIKEKKRKEIVLLESNVFSYTTWIDYDDINDLENHIKYLEILTNDGELKLYPFFDKAYIIENGKTVDTISVYPDTK